LYSDATNYGATTGKWAHLRAGAAPCEALLLLPPEVPVSAAQHGCLGPEAPAQRGVARSFQYAWLKDAAVAQRQALTARFTTDLSAALNIVGVVLPLPTPMGPCKPLRQRPTVDIMVDY
jgi:hypothetical protein